MRAQLLKGVSWQGERVCRRKNGEKYIVRASMTPLRDANGKFRHCIAVKEDVTAWKEEQESRRSLETKLFQAQKMETIGTLAGGIAHDFNKILTGILGFTELASSSLPADNSTKALLDEVRKAGLRARDLVAQILTFSRQRETRHVPIDLARSVGEALKFLRASLPATITIERRLKSGSVNADPTQIHQIVLNLCTNAVHAMRDSPGSLFVAVDPVEVDEALAASMPRVIPGKYLCLSVRDTGHGMSEDTLRRVFDPFFTTKQPGEGTGLGLAVVQGIVSAHGGGIRVESTAGVGSTFRIYLPATSKAEKNAVPAIPAAPGRGEHVLVVDDETSVGSFTGVCLEQQNYRVIVFDDPRRALAAVRANPHTFEALVTDLTMPGLTGLDLVREVREAGARVPAVIMTGARASLPDDLVSSLRDVALLEKPFTGVDLSRALRCLLDQRPR